VKGALSNGNWSGWSTDQGVVARVILESNEREARSRCEVTSTITRWIVRLKVHYYVIAFITNFELKKPLENFVKAK